MIDKLSPDMRVHFIGVGGVGMSALAQVLLKQGCRVSGCDLKENNFTFRLAKEGFSFYKGHSPEHVKGKDLVIYSSAVPSDHPEIEKTRELGIPLLKRGELLASLMEGKYGIAVCGAHGKTTTTSLIGLILSEGGLKPTVLVGGEVSHFGGNVQLGEGNIWVTEADESDGSFLHLRPKIGVVTNIDREHMDFYRDLEDVVKAYSQFIEQTTEQGAVVACMDDPFIARILEKKKGSVVTYGLEKTAQVQPRNIELSPLGSRFDLFWNQVRIQSIVLEIPGIHNVLNASAALAVGMELGLAPDRLAKAIARFQGVQRRFQLKSKAGDVWVIDDYAHHPTELAAVLEVAKGLGRTRVIGIFQPHRYTRTQALLKEFTEVLQRTDYLILTDIYSASEPEIPGVNSRLLFDKVVEYGHRSCEFLPIEKITDRIIELAQPGDTILFLGAGDITRVADEVTEKIKIENATTR